MRHLTLRVAWHDRAWDGTVCDHASENQLPSLIGIGPNNGMHHLAQELEELAVVPVHEVEPAIGEDPSHPASRSC